MKLGRFSEARYWGQQGIASKSNWQKPPWAGTFFVRRQEKKACVKNRWKLAPLLCTTLKKQVLVLRLIQQCLESAMAVFDFDKVEEYARLATRSGDGTTVSAWINLIHLYLNQGRADAAIEAVSGSLDSLQPPEEPAMRLQKRADVDSAFALVLLASGKEQTAFEKIDKALKYPDREA